MRNVLILLLLLFANASFSRDKRIDSYYKVLKKFRAEHCTGKDSKEFWSLTKKTNRGGYFVPTMHDGSLDVQTVQKLLPRVRDKKQWIQKNIEQLKKPTNLANLSKKFKNLKADLKILVGFKRKFFEEKNLNQKNAIKKLSEQKLQDFFFNLREALKEAFMLHSFSFPVDHKTMRRDYDSFKIRKDISGKMRANQIFFMRKLVEDGVRHPRWRGSDRGIRTLINTIYIRSINQHSSSFIDEDSRYDLDWLLERITDYLEFDISLIKKRLERWERATEKMYRFYIGLVTGSVHINNKKIPVKQFIEGKGRSRKSLKNFVYQKQADAYDFWTQQSEINRILYVLDTIILNEVGGTPDPGNLEKREVLQVVFNRKDLEFYSSLSRKDSIYKFLERKAVNIQKYPWLNTLFKEGEFSFTYYFLTASNHIFCPDMSSRANTIRNDALNIGLSLIDESKPNTAAVRYFSRVSMLGRIDMTDLWSGFSSLAETPGNKIEDKELTGLVKDREYEFLYNFTSSDKKDYIVVKIKGKVYVLDSEKGVYDYRNPHNFRYFVEK